MDLDDLYRFLRGSHVQAQGVIDTLRDPLLVLDSGLTVISANPAFYKTFQVGRDATVGVSIYELGDGQWDIEELRFLLEKVVPNSASVFDYEVKSDFPYLGCRTMLVSAQRLVHPDSGNRLLLMTIVDATERRERERQQALLIGEIRHRIKNLLSVTRALARQTSVIERTATEYRDDFLGRFDALSRSLDVSIDRHSAELPDLARAVLEPYLVESGRITLAEGPYVSLQPNQAMSLGLILHELATNAAKYGAFSVPEGHVAIDWNLVATGAGTSDIELRWKESGGPATSPPSSTGFGTRLIEAARHELNGRLELNYDPCGLIVTLRFPGG